MKKLVLTIVIVIFAMPVFAEGLSNIAVSAASDIISVSNIDTENNSAYVELDTISILYMANNNEVSVLIIDKNGNTIENSVYLRDSEKFEKISAVLNYKAVEKRNLLASIQ